MTKRKGQVGILTGFWEIPVMLCVADASISRCNRRREIMADLQRDCVGGVRCDGSARSGLVRYAFQSGVQKSNMNGCRSRKGPLTMARTAGPWYMWYGLSARSM